jgi:hypothetical protein
MTNGKKMYKVLSPMEKKGGGTYWMRIGTGYTNRDDSLNLYLDAMPPTNAKSNRYELQIRELTDEDLRKRETDSSHSSHGSGGMSNGMSGGMSNGMSGGMSNGMSGGYGASSNNSFSRDLGGIGGGPNQATVSRATSRAVTASGSDGEDVPF